jgi:hypothetical protein
MRISRWLSVTAAAALVAVVVAPAAASALLTNEWNQQFAGKAACIECHGAAYDATTHGQFVQTTTATIEPSQASGMYSGKLLNGVIDPAKVFTAGAGTGLREYLVFGQGTSGRFGVAAGLEWDPAEPSLWGSDGTVLSMTYEDYGCNQCHQLGATKIGVTPPGLNGVAGTSNAWAKNAADDPAAIASWIPGASIQCERCHGTGVAATSGAGGHWNSGVKIVGFNSPTMKTTAKAASTNILKSEVCGQCHGSFKTGGNIAGYTPDRNINQFMTSQYTLSDVPSEAAFLANPTAFKFFPNGENNGLLKASGSAAGLKHVYYTEWQLSGHSIRGFYSKNATDAAGFALTSAYQQSGASHYSSIGASRVLCNRCHTGEGYLKRKGATIMSGWTEGVDPAGQIGQECATCHVSHGPVGATDTASAVDQNAAVGMAVRTPEKANGNYSTLGLAVDNKSICEDCHNWQREVYSAGVAPTLPAVLGKYVSHPQREIYHGRAMLEIPAAVDFMPGAKCEQCHMPATKSDFPEKTQLPRYADRSWKRYSHRMFIMRPGDAKAWGLAPWGDSCSPCHAGETQDQLEANIVAWQADAAALANTASSTIAAQVTAHHNVAAGDLDLLQRASANLSLFVQDSSGGAHNPPYEKAGLTKAVALAKSAGGTISISAPASAGNMALFGIQGTVMNGDGTAAAGVTVNLYNGATPLGTSVSDAAGNYSFAQAQAVAKTYTVKWARSSQAVSDLSASASVNMASAVTKIDTDMTLDINRASAKRTVKYTISGSLSPAFAGATVVITYTTPGGSSGIVATKVSDSAGKFSVVTSARWMGTWTYRARFTGDATHSGASASHKIAIVR